MAFACVTAATLAHVNMALLPAHVGSPNSRPAILRAAIVLKQSWLDEGSWWPTGLDEVTLPTTNSSSVDQGSWWRKRRRPL